MSDTWTEALVNEIITDYKALVNSAEQVGEIVMKVRHPKIAKGGMDFDDVVFEDGRVILTYCRHRQGESCIYPLAYLWVEPEAILESEQRRLAEAQEQKREADVLNEQTNEAHERAQLARLRAKYPDEATP